MQPINKHIIFAWTFEMVFAQRQEETSTMSTAALWVLSSEIKKWLKFHDGQYQFKVKFMLYTDFESILKSVD